MYLGVPPYSLDVVQPYRTSVLLKLFCLKLVHVQVSHIDQSITKDYRDVFVALIWTEEELEHEATAEATGRRTRESNAEGGQRKIE